MKRLIFICLVTFFQINAWAQTENVGIGTTTPDSSAVLDITSSDKGMLTPRMSTMAREGISSPAEGLLVFDTDTNTFWYNSGVEWIEIGRNVRTWNEKIEKQLVDNLIRPDSVVRDYQFGASISIDGDRAIFGVLDDRSGFTEAKGEAHIYSYDGNEWVSDAILEASAGGVQRRYGISVDIDGDYAVVGSSLDNSIVSGGGSAYVYKYDGSVWLEEAKLEPNDLATGYEFGSSDKIDGDYIAISSMGALNSGNETGAVYIFHRSGTSWTEEAKVFDPTITFQQDYGQSIDLEGNTLAVCHLSDPIASDQFGSIHIYERSGTNWTEVQKVTYASPENLSYFGRSVTLSYPYMLSRVAHGSGGGLFGNVVIQEYSGSMYTQSDVIEEPYDLKEKFSFGLHIDMDADHVIVGSFSTAHLYSNLGNEWIHQMELTFPNVKTDPQLGHPCAIKGDHIIICEPQNDDIFIDNGAAYYVNRNEPLCDKDMDPTNEIETWATLQGIPADLLDGDDGDDLGNHMATLDLDMGNQKISNLGNPTLANDATTKSYVDGELTPLQNEIDANETSIVTNTNNINNNAANIFNNTLDIDAHVANDTDLSPTNELQTLSISGQDLTLSSGNTIVLPESGVFENNSGVVRNTGSNDDDFVFGSNELPPDGVDVTENLFFFDESQGAFRAGRTNGDKWSTSSLGLNSTAFGFNSEASGGASTALGNQTTASGANSLSAGGYSLASGLNSFSVGLSNISNGANSIAMGGYNLANAEFSIALGYNTSAMSYASLAIGRYNVGGGFSTTWVETDPLFEVGNGTDINNKSNALTILKNGTISFENYTFPNDDGTVDQVMTTDGTGDISWVDQTEGAFENNSGVVRNTGANTDDFVFGDSELPQNGVNLDENIMFFDKSEAVFRVGSGATMNTYNWSPDSCGFSSFAAGYNTKASGIYSTAFGIGTTASVQSSFAIGGNTIASGVNTFTSGSHTEASGHSASSFGYYSNASGAFSASFGDHTNSNAASSFSLGSYNIGGGDPTNWIGTDPIFEVGNGTDVNNKSNALTILKNGTVSFENYTFPDADGTANQMLKTDGAGNLDWISIPDDADSNPTNELLVGFNFSGNTLNITDAGGTLNADISSVKPHTIEDNEGDSKIEFNSTENKILFTTDGSVTAKIEPDSMYIDGTLKVGAGAGAKLYIGNAFLQSSNATIIKSDADLRPNVDDSFDLGSSGKKWRVVYATNGMIQTSDKRLKKGITSLNYGLEEVLELQPVQYHWKKEKSDDKLHVGLIAQELLQVIPEVVNEEGDYLGVKYAELVPVLIQAIQDQQDVINSQHSQLSALKNDFQASNENIEDMLSRLIHLEKSTVNE